MTVDVNNGLVNIGSFAADTKINNEDDLDEVIEEVINEVCGEEDKRQMENIL